MRILIAEDDAAVAHLIRSTLEKAGHKVDVATTGKIAMHRLEHASFDIFFVDAKLPDTDGSLLCQKVRRLEAHPSTVILMAAANGHDARTQATRAGADDCLLKPISSATLLHTVKDIASKSQQKIIAAKPATPQHPIEGTKAWKELPDALGKMLVECTTLPIRQADLTHPSEEIRATLIMVDVEHQIELAVGLFGSRASAMDLTRAMLGEPAADDRMMREVLAELCNNLLGVTKINMRGDNFPFTLSLPNKGNPPTFSELTRSLHASIARGYAAANIELQLVVGVRPTANSAMPVERLKENMVLAESVLNDGGVLVLAAGTRLTAASAARLAHHLPGKKVRVCVLDQGTAA